MNEEYAQAIALEALSFLASDPERLNVFMLNSGLTPQELMARASDNDMLVSILDTILNDEPLLLMFATERGIDPQRVLPARTRLAGEWDRSI